MSSYIVEERECQKGTYIRKVTGWGSQNLRLFMSDMLPCNFPSFSFQVSDTEQDPVGLLGTKPFCVFHFFDYTKQASFSIHEFPWVPINRFKQLLIRKGRGWGPREEQIVKRKDSVTWRQGPDSLSRDTDSKHLWAVLQILKPSTCGRSQQLTG